MNNWYKIDTAGKLFPAVQNTKNSSVYRISAVMSFPINKVHLQHAADTVAKRYPFFMVKLRKGVFWNYLEQHKDRLLIEEESESPCKNIDLTNNNSHLLKILYFCHRISIEFFHALADGYGATEFLKSLLYYYLIYCGKNIDSEGKILLEEDGTDHFESEDSFQRFGKKAYYETFKNQNAFPIKGSFFEENGINVIHGTLSANELNSYAKKHQCTITAFLCALLIYSIYQTRVVNSHTHLPIVVAVPVNLRKLFPSRTLRNFFGVINIGSNLTEQTKLEDLMILCQEMMKHKTSLFHLQNIISSNIALDQNKATIAAPLFIKKLALGFGFQQLGEKKKSLTLSNIGNIQLPDNMSNYIEQIETLLYPTSQSPINCGVCSISDKLTLTFTRNIEETDIIQYFFSHLAKSTGIQIEVYSNDWGKNDESLY